MFKLAEKKEIGAYLKKRIKEQRFKSDRAFCKKYLMAKGEQADDEQVQRMANRLSQILKGEKEIQLYDLPLFCRLLEVSCEDILSAGKSHMPTSAHLTNYTAAFSKDKCEWEAYVKRDDSLILNADEYGKTFIDYALEAENYDLLKYLMDKQYIWFVGAGEKDCFTGFGAGTIIEKAVFPYPKNWNILDVQLKMRDELRTHMIALAIQHRDMETLEQLHAREIPSLYQMSFFSSPPNTCEQYRNEKLMEALIHADDKILEYFSNEFEITDRVGNTNIFLFPFIGELIERLLQNKHNFAEYMLKNAIRHNQYVYDRLISSLTDVAQFHRKLGYDITNGSVTEGILKGLLFYDNGNLVSYFALLPGTEKGVRSNIIRINTQSTDAMINRCILELNDLYEAIHHIAPKFEEGAKHC